MRPSFTAALTALALLAACSLGSGPWSPKSSGLVQLVDDRGPAEVGPSLLVGGSIAELSALIQGAGGFCGNGVCWTEPTEPKAAYLAVIDGIYCYDRDLGAATSGSTLTLTIIWKTGSCSRGAEGSTLGYSLYSVGRQSLPSGRVTVSVRYGGLNLKGFPAPADGLFDTVPAPASCPSPVSTACTARAASTPTW